MLSREGGRYGISFLLTTSGRSGLMSRFLKNYPNEFVLDMNDRDSYIDILGSIGNTYPADFDGRGLFKRDKVLEFQTAKICDDNIFDFIKITGRVLAQSNKKARVIPVVPDIITYDMLSDKDTSLINIPLGIKKEEIDTYFYNFKRDKTTLISAVELESCFNVLNNLLKAFKLLNNTVSIVLDLENCFLENKMYANYYCNEKFDEFIDTIINYYSTKIKDTKFNLALFIIGVEKFKDIVSQDRINKLENLIKNNDNFVCLLIDNSFKFKKLAFESWYMNLVSNSNGIWIGQGVADQSVIKLNNYQKAYSKPISDEYGWIIKNGAGKLIKFVNKM